MIFYISVNQEVVFQIESECKTNPVIFNFQLYTSKCHINNSKYVTYHKTLSTLSSLFLIFMNKPCQILNK